MKGLLDKIKDNKVILKYLGSSFISLPISIFIGYFSLRMIDPELMGIWSSVMIIESYTLFLRLGVVNGMNREMPFALGSGKEDKAVRFAQTALGFTLVDIGVVLFAIMPVGLYYFTTSVPHILSLLVVIVKICVTFYVTYLTGTFRSNDHFNKLSNIQFYLSGVKILTAPLILFGFYGYLAYEVVYLLINAWLLHISRPFKIKPAVFFKELKELMAIGIPLFISSYLMGVFETFPRLYILNYGDEKLLGLYSPVLMILGVLAIVPNTLSTYMYPKYSYSMGKKNDIRMIWSNMLKIYGLSFAAIVFIAIIAWFSLDIFVSMFPKYAASLPYLRLSVILYPVSFFRMGNMINSILKNFKGMIGFAVVYGIIQAASLFVIRYYEKDTITVAILSQFVTWTLMLLISIGTNFYQVRTYKAESRPESEN